MLTYVVEVEAKRRHLDHKILSVVVGLEGKISSQQFFRLSLSLVTPTLLTVKDT